MRAAISRHSRTDTPWLVLLLFLPFLEACTRAVAQSGGTPLPPPKISVKLVIAALWSEMCLAQPAIHAMGEGYDVYAVTDASGGVSPEAHEMAIRRVVAAGAQPITWLAMAGELQRDWARTERIGEVGQILFDHAGTSGAVLAWELANEAMRASYATT
jgi:isochorismatase family protein